MLSNPGTLSARRRGGVDAKNGRLKTIEAYLDAQGVRLPQRVNIRVSIHLSVNFAVVSL